MRDRVASVVEVVGIVALVVGASLLASFAGWLVGGVMALAYARGLTR